HIVWISDLTVYFGDLSDDCFFITGDTPPPPPPGVLTLTAPNGGEEWDAGSTYAITWTSENLDGDVDIALMGGRHPGPGIYYIGQDIPVTDGTFDWTIPADMYSGTHYRVRIFLPADPGIAAVDISDAPFTIIGDSGPGSAEINVTSPNGGESWTLGSTQEITWTDEEYTGNVNIFLVRGVNPYHNNQIIEHHAPNTGSHIWTIPDDIDPGDDYKIHIVRPGGGMDFSDAPFSIIDPLANLKASPNPSKEGTSITFDLKAPASTSVRIYNVKGQSIRTLMENKTLQGKQSVTWDGKDQSGRKVTAGIYFAKITADKYCNTQKLIIMK
ncbi:MAG: Ser-Thr-rich GPI-anchored membrane family protein, partial [Candidatus Syntrophosphaera sp.]